MGSAVSMGSPRTTRFAAVVVFAALGALAAAPASAKEWPEAQPSPKVKGEAHQWKTAEGRSYGWYVPKDYDAKQGGNLVFMLHGNNMSRYWGLLNVQLGTFRPNDILISPDGTAANGNGGFNWNGNTNELDELDALQKELEETFNIRGTYLYGHSQGAFFAHFWAGYKPDRIQGLVAHAGHVWKGTKVAKNRHHQAIALMHGTTDQSGAPYVTSVETAGIYRDKKFPKLHFRTIQDWPHMPNAYVADQELTWCEGMASDDPKIVGAAFERLREVRDQNGWGRDHTALYDVAQRVMTMEGVPVKSKGAAKKVVASVEKLAAKHVTEIEKALKKGSKGTDVDDTAWLTHLTMFIRDFRGVPAADALRKTWQSKIDKHDKAAVKAQKEFYQHRARDAGKAFKAAAGALDKAWLNFWPVDINVVSSMEAWIKDAKGNKLSPKSVEKWQTRYAAYLKGKEAGKKAYAKISKASY